MSYLLKLNGAEITVIECAIKTFLSIKTTKTAQNIGKDILNKINKLDKDFIICDDGNEMKEKLDVISDTNLLKEDIEKAITEANKGLDFDKIADEVEQDLREDCPDVLCENCKKDCIVKELELIPNKQKEENNMMQFDDEVTTKTGVLTTSIYYGDSLRENIKAVIRSDMEEETKVNVIIGLCKQEIIQSPSYPSYPWSPSAIYASQSSDNVAHCVNKEIKK